MFELVSNVKLSFTKRQKKYLQFYSLLSNLSLLLFRYYYYYYCSIVIQKELYHRFHYQLHRRHYRSINEQFNNIQQHQNIDNFKYLCVESLFKSLFQQIECSRASAQRRSTYFYELTSSIHHRHQIRNLRIARCRWFVEQLTAQWCEYIAHRRLRNR